MIPMYPLPIVKINEIPEYLDKEIRDIKLVCEVVDKIDLDEDKLTIIRVRDDTGTIDVRLFGEKRERDLIIGGIGPGDKLLVIGFIVELDSEMYISPRGIRKINDEWYDYYLLRYSRFRKRDH